MKRNPLFDMTDGGIAFPVSDDTAIDSSGHIMVKVGDDMAMDIATGNIHFVPGWRNEDEED